MRNKKNNPFDSPFLCPIQSRIKMNNNYDGNSNNISKIYSMAPMRFYNG